jgi:hypothetical protein
VSAAADAARVPLQHVQQQLPRLRPRQRRGQLAAAVAR